MVSLRKRLRVGWPRPPLSGVVLVLLEALALLAQGCLVASDTPARPTPTTVPVIPVRTIARATSPPGPPPTIEAAPPTARPQATITSAPPAGTATRPSTGGTTSPRYVVEEGDTLTSLSRRFAVSVGDLASLNSIPVDANLRRGQELQLPRGIWSDRLAIRVTSPQPGASVRSPIAVEGTAATFESIVVLEAVGADGTQLAKVTATARNPDVGTHGPFRAELALPAGSAGRPVTVRLYWPHPRDGSPTDEIRIPVTVQ